MRRWRALSRRVRGVPVGDGAALAASVSVSVGEGGQDGGGDPSGCSAVVGTGRVPIGRGSAWATAWRRGSVSGVRGRGKLCRPSGVVGRSSFWSGAHGWQIGGSSRRKGGRQTVHQVVRKTG